MYRRRLAAGAFVAVVLVASSLALSNGVSAETSKTGSGGWWDGSGAPAGAPPGVVEEGWCGSYGGWLGLFAGAALAEVCPSGDGGATAGGPLSGSPRGVGWFEGYDMDGLGADGSDVGGPSAGVELFGAPGVAAGTYRALGVLDVVFDGGTFSADFSQCTHRAEPGYSSCVTRVAGTEPPPRAPRGASEGTATPAAEVDGADDYEAQWQPESGASSGAPSDGGSLSKSQRQESRDVLRSSRATDTPAGWAVLVESVAPQDWSDTTDWIACEGGLLSN